MNADGTINEEKYVSGHTEISHEPDTDTNPKIVKEDYMFFWILSNHN
jgi:hypothetical protein